MTPASKRPSEERNGRKEKCQMKVPRLAERVHCFRNFGGVPAEKSLDLTGGTRGEQIDPRRIPSPHYQDENPGEEKPERDDPKFRRYDSKDDPPR